MIRFKILLLCKGIFCCFFIGSLFSQNPIETENLAERVRRAYLNSDLDSLIYLGEKWIYYTRLYRDEDLPLNAIGTILEACKLNNDYEKGKKFLHQLKLLLESRKLFSRDSINYGECEALFNYYFNKGILEQNDGNFDQAIQSYYQTYSLVTSHRSLYSKIGNYTTRLMQVNRQLASLHIDSKNFNQARIYLATALVQAKFLDSLYKSPVFKYEPTVLSLYLKLPLKNDILQFWNSDKFDRQNKSVTNTITTNNFLKQVLRTDTISPLAEQSIKILRLLPTYHSDPEAILLISEYYLNTNRIQEASSTNDYFIKNISIENQPPDIRSKYHLLRAGIALARKNFLRMDAEIALSGVHSYPNSKPARSDASFLSSIHQASDLYFKAYKIINQPTYINQILALSKIIFDKLIALRQSAEKAQDRSDLMREFGSYVDLVVRSYFEANKLKINFDSDGLLGYVEINKSFNLRNETRLKLESMNEQQRKALNNIQLQIDHLETAQRNSKSLVDSIEIKLGKLQKEKTDLLAAVPIIPWTSISIDLIRQRLDLHTSIIDFYVTQDRDVFLIFIQKNEISLLSFEGKNDSLYHWVNEFHTCMQTSPTMMPTLRDSIWAHASNRLFDAIISPLHVEKGTKLVFIPDGIFSLLPFGALLSYPIVNTKYVEWPYMIKDYPISNQNSLQLWLEYNADTTSISQPMHLSVFAPVFTDLKYNIKEKDLILKNVRYAKALPADVSLKSLGSRSAKSQILHIASHAKSSFVSDAETYLRGSRDSINAIHIANNIYHQNLVFLSACETGLGEHVLGEGVFSLSRSFLKAGARSVISTLWKINDKISADQVFLIYKNLIKGYSKDEAIRSMQLEYIRGSSYGNKYAMPYYWAAYQCHGDSGPIPGLKEKSNTGFWILLSLSIGIVFYLLLRMKLK